MNRQPLPSTELLRAAKSPSTGPFNVVGGPSLVLLAHFSALCRCPRLRPRRSPTTRPPTELSHASAPPCSTGATTPLRGEPRCSMSTPLPPKFPSPGPGRRECPHKWPFKQDWTARRLSQAQTSVSRGPAASPGRGPPRGADPRSAIFPLLRLPPPKVAPPGVFADGGGTFCCACRIVLRVRNRAVSPAERLNGTSPKFESQRVVGAHPVAPPRSLSGIPLVPRGGGGFLVFAAEGPRAGAFRHGRPSRRRRRSPVPCPGGRL